MHNKNLAPYVFDLCETVKTIIYIAIFFYISQIIWPYIVIPFSNADQFIGSIVKLGFNPLNNTVRYLVSLLIILGGFTFISLFSTRHKKWIMRIIFVAVLIVSYFLTAFVHPGSKYYLDIFHDGVQIGSAALHLQGRPLYTGNMLVHGSFNDPMIAVYAFKLFGKSIGSFFLMTALVRLITFTLFFTLLMIVIESDLIFYFASIWFFNLVSATIDAQLVNFVVSTIRDINVWIILILLWFLIKKSWFSKVILFFIGFLVGLEYFISLDRAYILSVILLFLFLYRLILTRRKSEDGKTEAFQHDFHIPPLFYNFKRALFLLIGLLTGLIVQIPLMGWESFLEFLNFALREYPKMGLFTSVQIFPSYSEAPYSWLPIFMIIFSGSYVFHKFFLPAIKDKHYNIKLSSGQLYIGIIFVFSIVFFLNGINGNDHYHLYYGSTVIFLVVFLILDHIYLTIRDTYLPAYSWYEIVKNFVGIAVILYVIFSYNAPSLPFVAVKNFQKTYLFRRPECYIDKEDNRDSRFQSFVDYYLLNHLRCPPYRSIDDIKNFFSLNQRSDTEFLPPYSNKIVNYLNNNTTENDYVFVFSNEPGYYYFLKAKSPTRFSLASFAASRKYRDELLNDLKQNQPKLILYSTSSWPEATMKEKFPEIDAWMLKNYPQKTVIDQATILEKEVKTDFVPTPTSSATPSATPKPKKVVLTLTPTPVPTIEVQILPNPT